MYKKLSFLFKELVGCVISVMVISAENLNGEPGSKFSPVSYFHFRTDDPEKYISLIAILNNKVDWIL